MSTKKSFSERYYELNKIKILKREGIKIKNNKIENFEEVVWKFK